MTTAALVVLLLLQDATDLKKTLSREIIGPKKAMEEIQDFIEWKMREEKKAHAREAPDEVRDREERQYRR
jgi:HSP90 family molecular chaperone